MAVDPQEIDIEKYNSKVTGWGSMVATRLRASARSKFSKAKKGNKTEKKLADSIRLKAAKWYGEVDKLSYHFARHGVFVHKGVGRGYHMEGGKVIRTNTPGKILSSKSKGVNSFVLKSTAGRQPVEWFNPVVNENIEKLADMVAEMDADRLVNTTKILIK